MEEEKKNQSPPTKLPARSPVSSVDREKRRMEIVICTPQLDRQGDIVEPEGLDFTNYLNNPVLLWAHDVNRPPVGKIVEINNGGSEITAIVEFAETDFASEVFELYAGGYLNAWSIGFIPQRWKRMSKNEGGGFHVYQAEIVEVSAVPVPANAKALTKALEGISDQDLQQSLQNEMSKNSEGDNFADEEEPFDDIEDDDAELSCGNADEILAAEDDYRELLEEFAQHIMEIVENVFAKLEMAR